VTGDAFGASPRPISTGPLKGLPLLHFRPIYLVIFQGSYPGTQRYRPELLLLYFLCSFFFFFILI